ncbi:MAG: glycosyltransferase family 4 protein [candidate division WOR-3 bacterium]|jgi:glycosyltransferase involved in cell wall biosynthesis
MKVLFVATAYPRFRGDIITPWLVELIMKLRQEGIDVSVYTSSYKGLRNHILDSVRVYRFRYCLKRFERFTHEETAVDRVRRGPSNVFLSVLYLFFGAWAMIRLSRHERFDIVHIHWPFPHVIFGVLAKKFGHARLFNSFYGVEIRWLKKKFPFLVKPFSMLMSKSDTVTAISTHTAKELSGIVKKPAHIIPFSAAMAERHGKISDKKEIIFVGRLVERKGVRYLIEAFSRAARSIPHNLVIIGDGPERARLQGEVQRLEIAERVRFTGMITDDELKQYYQSCSFFVLPAVYDKKGDTEGLGVVLLEAMSYRKPVIASGVGGITDIVVDGKNGLLVPPADVVALAQAIEKMAKNRKLRVTLGRAARKTVDEKFNWDKIVRDLITLYREENE